MKRRPLLYHRRFPYLPVWKPAHIFALRYHMGLTQAALAEKMQIRQATISEWENGVYHPRRTMRLQLTILADQTAFPLRKDQYGTP